MLYSTLISHKQTKKTKYLKTDNTDNVLVVFHLVSHNFPFFYKALSHQEDSKQQCWISQFLNKPNSNGLPSSEKTIQGLSVLLIQATPARYFNSLWPAHSPKQHRKKTKIQMSSWILKNQPIHFKKIPYLKYPSFTEQIKHPHPHQITDIGH